MKHLAIALVRHLVTLILHVTDANESHRGMSGHCVLLRAPNAHVGSIALLVIVNLISFSVCNHLPAMWTRLLLRAVLH